MSILSSTVTPAKFFGYLFSIRDMVHLTHLAQPDKSYATHKVLNDFYEGILDLTDDIVEAYQGLYGIVPITIPSTVASNNPLKMIQDCNTYVQQNRSIFKESFLQNIIDEMSQLIASTLFKLRFVQ